MATAEIKAAARPKSGKGAARQARRDGMIPGVIYGDGKAPETISVNAHELTLTINKGKFLSTLFDVDVEGKKTRVIPRDVQLDRSRPWSQVLAELGLRRHRRDARILSRSARMVYARAPHSDRRQR